MARIIFAFNGDLESRLALHWLVHDQGHEVITLSINLGQEEAFQPLGEQALELGAVAAQVIDCRDMFLRNFALPLLQANAVYQDHCYLGTALARYVIAQELVRVAREEGCEIVAHSAASKGNDQVRMETAIAAQAPELTVLAAVREWPLRTETDKAQYAQRHDLTMSVPTIQMVKIDRNLWGSSIYIHNLDDPWQAPPENTFVLTRSPENAPEVARELTIGFDSGVPSSLDGEKLQLVSLVRTLNRIAGEHGIGRKDVVEDRLFGIKSREFYEAPASSLLYLAHHELENLVQSRELRGLKDALRQRYAELVYSGFWFHEVREALDCFFRYTQRFVSGEVRFKLYKGVPTILGRRSPYSLYDSQLANQANLDLFDNQWAQGFTSLWSLSSRLAAKRRSNVAKPSDFK